MPDEKDGGSAAPSGGGSPEEANNTDKPRGQGPRRRRRGRRKNPKNVASKPEPGTAAPDVGDSETGGGKKSPQPPRRRRGPGARAGGRSAPKHGRFAHTFAALDLGTNNCRLLVARPLNDSFRIIDAFSRTVRLGAGLNTEENGVGALTNDAMDRAVEALKVCSEKMKRRGVTRALCIATEACRTASNGASFIARAEAETGLSFEIITTEKEAALAVSGCTPLLDTECEAAMVFDIGGGSTELIWLDLAPMKDQRGEPKIVAWTSLPFGVVTLAESYLDRSPQTRDEELALYQEMVLRVRTEIEKFKGADPQRDLYDTSRAHLIGNSGTVTTLAAVHLGLHAYDRSKVDGLWIDGQSLYDLVERLAGLGTKGRAEIPSIGTDRADLLFPGCAILRAIQETWPSDRVRVADRGLREGILVGLMEEADRESGKKRKARRGNRGGRRAGRRPQDSQGDQATNKSETLDPKVKSEAKE